jgi:hypothetical protein
MAPYEQYHAAHRFFYFKHSQTLIRSVDTSNFSGAAESAAVNDRMT